MLKDLLRVLDGLLHVLDSFLHVPDLVNRSEQLFNFAVTISRGIAPGLPAGIEPTLDSKAVDSEFHIPLGGLVQLVVLSG